MCCIFQVFIVNITAGHFGRYEFLFASTKELDGYPLTFDANGKKMNIYTIKFKQARHILSVYKYSFSLRQPHSDWYTGLYEAYSIKPLVVSFYQNQFWPHWTLRSHRTVSSSSSVKFDLNLSGQFKQKFRQIFKVIHSRHLQYELLKLICVLPRLVLHLCASAQTE